MSYEIIKQLAPLLQPIAWSLIRKAGVAGLVLLVPPNGGARSEATQWALYQKGRRQDELGRWRPIDPVTRKGIVTRAMSAADSAHGHGAAIDTLIVEHGKVLPATMDLPTEERDRQVALYAKLGAIGKALGLEWGGEFKDRDLDHFQLPTAVWRALPLVDDLPRV